MPVTHSTPSIPIWLQRLVFEGSDYVPPTLYHYTSHGGITGILTKRKLWATNILCLNDEQEYKLACRLAIDIAEQLGGDYKEFVKPLQKEPRLGSASVYVVSLTRHDDQLSQWRGYCANANGYAVGFAAAELKAPPVNPGFLLARCVYDRDTQVNLVKQFLGYLLKKRKKAGATPQPKLQNAAGGQLSQLFPILASILKPSGFQEEAEWRLVATSISPTDPRVQFRPGPSYVIPYVEVTLREQGQSWCLPRIVTGPSANHDVATHALQTLLARHNVECGAIEKSTIPYRAG